MSEDPVSATKVRPSGAAKRLAMPLLVAGAAVALSVGAYLAYQYLSPKPSAFTIKGADSKNVGAIQRQAELVAQGNEAAAALENVTPVRAEPIERPQPAKPVAPQIADLEKASQQSASLAIVRPYTGYVVLPMALVAFAPAPDGDTQSVPTDSLAITQDPVGSLPGTPQDAAIRSLLAKWQQSAMNGGTGVDLLSEDSRRTIDAANLPCPTLYALGYTVGLVDGDKVSAAFYRAAVARAESDLKSLSTQSSAARQPTVDALCSMAEFFAGKLQDGPTAEHICSLLRSCQSGNSDGQRKADMLLAKVLLAQGTQRSDAARTLLDRLLSGQLTDSQRQQVTCMKAQLLFDAGRYQDVSALLESWGEVNVKLDYADSGWMLLIRSAVKQDKADEARRLFADWRKKAGARHRLALDRESILVAGWPDY